MPYCVRCNIEHTTKIGQLCYECRTEMEMDELCKKLGLPTLEEVNYRILQGQSRIEATKKKSEKDN